MRSACISPTRRQISRRCCRPSPTRRGSFSGGTGIASHTTTRAINGCAGSFQGSSTRSPTSGKGKRAAEVRRRSTIAGPDAAVFRPTPRWSTDMARIIGGIAASHTPTIGFAYDKKKQNDPVWAPIFENFAPLAKWLSEKRPDVLLLIYNDHVTSFFFAHYSAFALGVGPQWHVTDEGAGAPD